MNDLLQAIDAAEATAYGGTGSSDISEQRARSIDLYLGTNVNPAPEGRSQVISRDVFDTIETMRPAFVKIFASGEEVVKCMPVGPEDEEAAQQESAYLNYVVTELNPWTQIVNDVASDAMISKNGYVLAYWDDTKNYEKETYKNQSPESAQMLTMEPGVEVLEQSADMGDDGQPTITLTIKREQQKGQLKLCVLPPERCKVSERTPDFTLRDCPYFEYWENKTISYVRQMGFDIDDDIADAGEMDSVEDQSRDRFGESVSRDSDGVDPSGRLVKLRMVWIRYDADGDGIAELIYAIVVGDQVLYQEEVNRIPVASFCPIPVAHRHPGISIADVVEDIQEQKTAVLRQGLDNLYQTNNMRMFASEKINLDDLLTNTPGGIVRARQSGALMGQDLAPIQVPFIFPQAMQGLEYLDSVRQNRTGTNSYFAGTDQNALNKTASGIAQLSSQASQRVEQIARMFAVGFEYLMQVSHELILKHGHKAQVVKLRGKWAQVDPRQWRKRSDIRISVGLGTGNKEVVLANLAMVFDRQMGLLQLGAGVVNPPHLANTFSEIIKTIGFANSQKFVNDAEQIKPPGPPPPDPLMEKTKMEQQGKQALAQLQAQIDTKRLELDAISEMERITLEKYKVDTDAAVRIQIEQIKHEASERAAERSMQAENERMGITYQREDMKAAQEAEKAQEGDPLLAELLSRSDALDQKLTQITQAIAPQ